MIRSRRKKIKQDDKNVYRVNERIRIPEVVVIDETGKQLGVMKTFEALGLARERGLDLVEVSPKPSPSVCKILDYGQFQYQQSRKLQAQKALVKKVETKIIRISFKIGKHDLELKQNQAKKFLAKGNKVAVEMILRGREKQHRQKAMVMTVDFIKSTDENIFIEQPVTAQGSKIFALINLQKSE